MMQTKNGYKPYILLEGQTSQEQAGDLIWAKVETGNHMYSGGAVLNGSYRYHRDELLYLYEFSLDLPEEIAAFKMLYPGLVEVFPSIKQNFDLYRDIEL